MAGEPGSSGIQIRRLAPSDASDVERILKESHASAVAPIGPQWTSAQVVAECQNGLGFAAFFDAAGGTLVGFILCRDLFEAWEISFLATSPEARGRGVMKALLRALVLEKPQEKGLWLEVHEANVPARQLYESFGFEQVGRRPKYYADGGAACLYNYG